MAPTPRRRPRLASRRRISPVAVPSFFTLGNLLCGFLAVVHIAEGRFAFACWFIILAGVFDLLDGMVARMANAQSEFGVQLDSLADTVSFGLAPAFLVYTFALSEYRTFGTIVSALLVLAGVVRLARFNVSFDGEKKESFTGLPIPMQAATVVALILNVDRGDFTLYSPGGLSLLVPVVIGLAALMVSTVDYDSGPKPSPRWIRAHPRKAVLYLVGLLLVLFLQQRGLLIVLVAYHAINIGAALVRFGKDVRNVPHDDDPGPPPGPSFARTTLDPA